MRRLILCLPLLLASPAWGLASKDLPAWVTDLSSHQLPAYPGQVAAVVLLNDKQVTLDSSGMLTIVQRSVIRILNERGKGSAFVRVHYWKNRRDVKDLHAWLISPDGTQKTFDKSAIVERGAYGAEMLYADGRTLEITALNSEVGSVFASEYTIREKALTAQDEFYFQSVLPAIQARYTLTLPTGWTAKGLVFSHPLVNSTLDGGTYTWEAKDLPFRDFDGELPSDGPRLFVSFNPPAGTSPATASFTSWADVSRWQSSLSQGQDEVTPEIAAQVAKLTAGAKSDYDKLFAISHYVQNIRYVAIEMDLQDGGGYVPHAAADVFANQYGDCKDKANLMHTMLKAAGFDSYLVAIYANGRNHVRPQWPSPHQFNHMILAAKVPDTVTGHTTLTTPFGRLLLFDPTDGHTPLGDLPAAEQGSNALVLAGAKGDLLKMPVAAPEDNLSDLSIEATLAPDGGLTASVHISRTGQPASVERRIQAAGTPDQYKNYYVRLLSTSVKNPAISKLTSEDRFAQNQFELNYDFDSRDYGQSMQGRLLVFSPSVVEIPRSVVPAFPKSEKRINPIVLRAVSYRKTVHLKYPAEYALDEAPSPVKLENEFAKFSLTYKPEAGVITVTEELRVDAVSIPATQFETVKQFFDDCRGADRQNAVLAKK
jgi:hypothetical protein